MNMENKTRVIILSLEKGLEKEDCLVTGILQEGYDVYVYRNGIHAPYADNNDNTLTIFVADYMSLMMIDGSQNAYADFLQQYSRKRTCRTRLIIVLPREQFFTCGFIGYGSLVDAYLFQPFCLHELLVMLDGVRKEPHERNADSKLNLEG